MMKGRFQWPHLGFVVCAVLVSWLAVLLCVLELNFPKAQRNQFFFSFGHGASSFQVSNPTFERDGPEAALPSIQTLGVTVPALVVA